MFIPNKAKWQSTFNIVDNPNAECQCCHQRLSLHLPSLRRKLSPTLFFWSMFWRHWPRIQSQCCQCQASSEFSRAFAFVCSADLLVFVLLMSGRVGFSWPCSSSTPCRRMRRATWCSRGRVVKSSLFLCWMTSGTTRRGYNDKWLWMSQHRIDISRPPISQNVQRGMPIALGLQLTLRPLTVRTYFTAACNGVFVLEVEGTRASEKFANK